MTIQAQQEKILAHLESGKPITPIDALREYGCFRLGARIWDLRRSGHNIITNIVTKNGKHFAEYRLI